MTKNEKYIVDMYVRYFGRAADAATIATYAEDKKTSAILKNIIADADAEKGQIETADFVNNAFQNLFGRDATTKEMNKYSKVIDAGKDLPINSIVKSAAKTDKKVYDNKIAVANKNAELGGAALDLSNISKGNTVDLNKVFTLTDLTNAIGNLADNSVIPNSFDGKTFVLTTSVDTGKAFVGTAKNDEFIASDAGPGGTTQTWTVADTIDGGKGTDGLTIVSATAVGTTQFANNTMKSIEIVDITTTGAGEDIDLNTTQAGKVAENFKAVTDLKLTTTGTGAASNIKVVGGKNIVAKATGTITINEDGDATTAATIEKITIDSAGNGATIGAAANASVDALKELTVKNGVAAKTVAVTTAVETLKVNLDDSKATSVVDLLDIKLKTLNVDASGKDSSVDFDTSSTILETLNISGNAKLTLEGVGAIDSTVITTSNVKEINVTNTKGVTIVDALKTDVKFTGGAGNDSVVLGATTKAIAMGAGDDTVTYGGALGTGGSVDAGAGKDTIKMTSAYVNAINTSTDNKFNTTFSNFEVLEISGAATAATNINTKKFNNVSQVTVAADLADFASTIDNLVDGGTVKFTAAQTTTTNHNLTVKILDADLSTTNVLNLEVSSAGAAGSGIDVKTVTAAGVETININVADAVTTGSAAVTHGLTLAATSATSVVVSGNNGLTLTNDVLALNTKITTFDASGVVANGSGDTDAKLGVTFVSVNDTAGQAVTIIGGAGNDDLTGNAKANDTIIGGKGNDKITYTGGKDSFTGGEGADEFIIDTGALGTTVDSVYLTIQDLTKGDKINVNAIGNVNVAAATALNPKIAVGEGATFSQALDAAVAKATVSAPATAVLQWFQFENNTYLVVDKDGGAKYTNGVDSVIKITGLVDLSASTVDASNVITIA